MKPVLIATFIALIAISGCRSTSEAELDPRAAMMAMQPAIDSVPSSGLGPQELLTGECALFLWSQTDVSKFIFFSKALSGRATFAQGELPETLTQTNAGDDIFGQFNTRSSYLFEDGRALTLTFDPGELLEGGQRLENGLITLTDLEGWQTKLPVLGVRACQSE